MVLKYPSSTDRKWTAMLSASAGSYSDPQIIPGFVDDLVALLSPGSGGTARLQFTADNEDNINDNPGGVTWISWNRGYVSEDTAQTALGAVSAVRIEAVTEDATCNLVGHRRTIRR